jgi:hypothetical protein
MKCLSRCAAAAAVLTLAGLTGCRSTETVDTEVSSMGVAARGVGGTGVGARSIETAVPAQTGSSTQRTGTGYAGSVTAPGPGQSGR